MESQFPNSSDKTSTNGLSGLPVFRSIFIGRERELDEITSLLDTARLIVLTGPGGVGKTRLAVQVASDALAAFPDGVYYLSLESIPSPELLVLALYEALDIPTSGATDLILQLAEAVADRNMLLVLDNFEHLTLAAEIIETLLARAPGLRILVTSREHLNLRAESPYPVSGMQLPESEDTPEADSSDAMRLFLQAVRWANPGFTCNERNRSAAIRICRLVDGMALALELAAAWVRALSCTEIANEIERDLGFLDDAWTNLPARHRSLRAILDSSWNKLDAGQQLTFSRLSVFCDGFTREASRQVTDASPESVASLVDGSLLLWDVSKERYAMHPLLHRYAAEKLADNPAEEKLMRERHCRYYCQFLREHEKSSKLRSMHQIIHEISEDLANVRAAWDYAVQCELDDCLEISVAALHQYLDIRNRYDEGYQMLSSAIDKLRADPAPSPGRIRILHKILARRAFVQYNLGQISEANSTFAECLRIADEANESTEMIYCRLYLGLILAFQRRFPEAKSLFDAALKLSQETGWIAAEIEAYRFTAKIIFVEGQFPESLFHFQKSMELSKEACDERGEAAGYRGMGLVAEAQGDYAKATKWFNLAMGAFIRFDDSLGQALILENLGLVYLAQQQFYEAADSFERANTIMHRLWIISDECETILFLGRTHRQTGFLSTAREELLHVKTICEARGWAAMKSIADCELSAVANLEGQFVQAEAFGREAVEGNRMSGDRSEESNALLYLADALLASGKYEEAYATNLAAVTIRRELGQEHRLAPALAGWASASLGFGDSTQARNLALEALERLSKKPTGGEDAGTAFLNCYRVLCALNDPLAREVLVQAKNALEAGADCIHNEAMKASFMQNIPAHRELMTLAQSTKACPDVGLLLEPLTKQEAEILRMLASGASNQQIALSLTIAIGTVKTHTHNIYRKLGVSNRTQAILHAREIGLL